MKTNDSQTLEFLYQETEIHFLINPKDDNVLINATEMGNIFSKKAKDYLKTEQTKSFIKVCCSDENFNEIFGFGTILSQSENDFGEDNIPRQNKILTILEREDYLFQVKTNGRNNGTWMHEIIALDFAAWLDPNFRFWVFNHIRKITFGHLKEYRDAMREEFITKNNKETLRIKAIKYPSQENIVAYFENEDKHKQAINKKKRAASGQLNLFKQSFK